ncbi:MAG: septum formation initiator family protein [Synergistales bacterium]
MVRLRWVFTLAVLGVILAIIGTGTVIELRRANRLKSMVDARMEEMVRLSRTIQELQTQLRYLQSPEGIARKARQDFNLTFPGEKIYRIEIESGDRLPQKGP